MGTICERQVMNKIPIYKNVNLKIELVNHKQKGNDSIFFLMSKPYKRVVHRKKRVKGRESEGNKNGA